jgi:hypothetical protein
MYEKWILNFMFCMAGQPVNLYHICFDVELYQKVSTVGPSNVM